MADVKQCDNCGAIEDDTDNLLWWVKVGWFEMPPEEACSLTCAVGLVEALERRRLDIEAEMADAES